MGNATRNITVAIDTACTFGGEPLIWGIAEGDDSDAALDDATRWLAGGDTPTKRHRRDAETLDLTTIQWPADEPKPDGQNQRAIALALAALAPATKRAADDRVMLRIDFENDAETWWGATIRTGDAPAAFAALDGSCYSEIECSRAEAEAVIAWGATLPGWSDGPEYARYPLIVVEIDRSRHDNTQVTS